MIVSEIFPHIYQTLKQYTKVDSAISSLSSVLINLERAIDFSLAVTIDSLWQQVNCYWRCPANYYEINFPFQGLALRVVQLSLTVVFGAQ